MRFHSIFACASLALLLCPRWASAGSPIPEFPIDGVAISGVPDTFDPLRSDLAELTSRVDAEYVVAVVGYSDPQDRAGPDYGDVSGEYIDAVSAAFRPHLDAARMVVIVMAVENRDIIVQPGSEWVRLGFEGDEVVGVIDESRFAEDAGAGDYNRALIDLIRSIDRDLAERVTQREARLADGQARIDTARHLLGELGSSLESSPLDLDDARETYAQAEDELSAAQDSLDAGRVDASLRHAEMGAELLRLTESRISSAENRARVRRLLVRGGIVAAALFIVFLALLRVVQLRWRRRAAGYEIAEWQTLLNRAGERLLALENEYSLLLGRTDLIERFSGATAQPVRRVAGLVDDLFMAYEAAQGILSKAEAELESAGVLRGAGIVSAQRRLNQDQVVVRTEDVTERHLFLPHKREVRMGARELLAHLDASYSLAAEELGQVTTRITESWAALDRALAELRAIESLEATLEERGLDPSHYRDQRESHRKALDTLRTRGASDPIGVVAETAELTEAIIDLRVRCQRIDEAIARLIDEVRPSLEAAEEAAKRLEDDEDVRLEEPGFEPDVMMLEAQRHDSAAFEAAGTGDDEAAVEHAMEAAEVVNELTQLIRDVEASREQSPERLTELDHRVTDLRERLPERRERLATLRREHADDALQPALDNAEESQLALDYASHCLTETGRALSPAEQRYLAAAELLRRADHELNAVDDLFAEIETMAETLEQCREQTRAQLDQSRGHLDRLTVLLDGDVPFATDATRRNRADLTQELTAIEADAGAERPNWRGLRARSGALAKLSVELVEHAQREREAHQAVQTLIPVVDAKRDGLSALLEASEEDRAATNERFQAASQLVDQAQAALNGDDPDWIDLRLILENADRLLDETKQLAQADFTAAQAARDALARASLDIRGADRPYGYAVSADLVGTRSLLSDAQAALMLQDYQRSAELSARASRESAQAALEAQRRSEREARRARSSVSSLGSSFRSGSSSSSRSTGSSFGSSSSRHGSTHSSSRSSHRSSFGSSSGRSSFKHSSGRSSFKRSSGRSKW